MQTCRQTGRQTDRQTDRQAERQTGRRADRQTDKHTYMHTYRHTDIHTGRQTGMHLHQYQPWIWYCWGEPLTPFQIRNAYTNSKVKCHSTDWLDLVLLGGGP